MKLSWNSRDELPVILNDLGLRGIYVEVGVQRGVFLDHVRRNWGGDLVLGVDSWKVYPGGIGVQEVHDQYRRDASDLLATSKRAFGFLQLSSLDAARIIRATIGLGKLDAVYLDADHSYEAVKADIEAWTPLVRSGGVVAGHDFVTDGWHRDNDPVQGFDRAEDAGYNTSLRQAGAGPFGVRRAVKEAFGESISVTSPEQDRGWQSWAVIV